MTSTKRYNLLTFIGRFQPLHLGHQQVINRALELSEQVLVLVGSANRSRDERNPWTYAEREQMIRTEYPTERVVIRPIDDYMYNDEGWLTSVHNTVRSVSDGKIGLIGFPKDGTSYYLDLFPTFASERVEIKQPLSSTDIRNEFFGDFDLFKIEGKVSSNVINFLMKFHKTDEYMWLKREIEFNHKYKDTVAKFPRIEHTVDSVVVQSGHVLLVRRRREPGMGKWALPGGFVNLTESLVDSAIRELREETKIKVPEPVLRGSIVADRPFDDPYRSSRGRIITHAFLIMLNPGQLPKVKGSDDADKAQWVPLSEINPAVMFEDHYFIIQKMLGMGK